MKKITALALVLAFALAGCVRGEEVSSVSDINLSETEEISSEQSILPVDKTQLIATAENLINTDITLARITAGGMLSDGETGDKYVVAEGTYGNYSVISAMAESTYTDIAVADTMLSLPQYGEPSVIEKTGDTYYKYTYINQFAAGLKNPVITLISYDDVSALISVSVSGKTVEIGMTNRHGRWYLDNSVYLAYLQSEEQAQTSGGWENNIYLGSRQNVGSMSALQGKMLVLNVFLNDTFSSWSDDDRNIAEDNVDRACEWLISKSREYENANLTIDTQSLFYVHRDTVPTNYQMAFLDIMFQNTIYVDVNGYVEKNTPAGYDNVCVIFHVWKNGTDYCIPCDTANTDYLTYYGERAMFYYSKNAGHAPSSYASKILQLAGGEKLYESDYQKELFYLFPKDIMLQKNVLDLPLQDFEISPLTAFLIGWTEHIDIQLIPYTNLQGEQ